MVFLLFRKEEIGYHTLFLFILFITVIYYYVNGVDMRISIELFASPTMILIT